MENADNNSLVKHKYTDQHGLPFHNTTKTRTTQKLKRKAKQMNSREMKGKHTCKGDDLRWLVFHLIAQTCHNNKKNFVYLSRYKSTFPLFSSLQEMWLVVVVVYKQTNRWKMTYSLLVTHLNRVRFVTRTRTWWFTLGGS